MPNARVGIFVSRLAVVACALCGAASARAQYESGSQATRAAPPISLKKALKEGRPLVGATISVPNVATALAAANAGFDFLWIEMEHGPISLQSLHEIILATKGTPAVPVTRVAVNQPWLAKQVLDMGSLGVIFPFTSTPELARQAVAACKYPPAGVRGFGPSLATTRYGLSGADYAKFADENAVVVVIIEQKEAVDQIDAIADVPGIDVLFIGANDLSYSMGVRGNTRDPMVEKACDKVLAAGKKRGIPVGYPAGAPDEINRRIAQGYRFFQAGSETSLMRAAARDLFSKIDRTPKPARTAKQP
jgi:2-keto-3-deoxy-L-rhamnonate aldolase RhmA